MKRFDGIIIFCDFDNTLTSRGKKAFDQDGINPNNFEAVKRFVENGGRFVMASGRNPDELEWLSEKMPIDDVLVCTNGSFYSISAHKPIRSVFVADDFLDDLNTIIKERNLKHFRIVDNDFVNQAWFDDGNESELQVIKRSKPPYYKVTFSGKGDVEYSNQLLAYLKTNFSHKYTIEASFVDFLEMYSLDAGKHKGMLALAKHYNARRIICVGDQENDINMIKCADVGVCVGDGVDAVKKVASVVCAPSTQGAIADVIRMLEEGLI